MKLLLSIVLTTLSLPMGPLFAATGASAPTTAPFSDKDEFERRFKKVDAKDVAGLLELASWAKSKKLDEQAKRCYRKVIDVELDNETANLALGNVKVGNRWVPKSLADKARQELEQSKANEAEGEKPVDSGSGPIVLDLPQEDTDRAVVKGKIKANTDKAKKLAAKFSEVAGLDAEELSAAITDHLVIVAMNDEDAVHTLAQIGEYVYRRLNWITWGTTDKNCFRQAGGQHVYWLLDKDTYPELLAFLPDHYVGAISRDMAKEMLQDADRTGGNSIPGNIPMHLSKMPEERSSTVANGMGHHWLVYNTFPAHREVNIKTGEAQGFSRERRGNLLNWMKEGVGIWASMDAIGRNSFFRVNKVKYAGSGGRASKGEDSDYTAACYEVATNAYGKGAQVRSFYQLTRTELNQLTDLDLAMSWSIVDWLIRERTQAWRTLLRGLGRYSTFREPFVRTFGKPEDITKLEAVLKEKDDRGLEDVYTTVAGRFEQDWKDWVKREYKAEYDDPSKRKQVQPPFTPIERGTEGEKGDGKEKEKEDDKPKKRRRR